MMRPLYIFDLDGTLSLNQHRAHFLTQEPKDWNGYLAACGDDPQHAAVAELFRHLKKGADCWIWTGRSETAQAATERWLIYYCLIPDRMRMRPEGDRQLDETLKRDWLLSMSPRDYTRLVCVFEDRDRMVKMYRNQGICCLQVAPGDF